MVLQNVVPFGRSFDEYAKMFNLSAEDLAGSILGVGDGPASFNAEGTQLGHRIVSIDPVYAFTGAEIQSRFDAVVDDIIGQVAGSIDDRNWSYHRSPETLRLNRTRALNAFLQDYEAGKQRKRYMIGELPQLPFESNQFSLALCSHFLFLYSDHFNEAFHLRSIQEMLRVATEVRIFPLLTLSLKPSPYVDQVVRSLNDLGHSATIESVQYEFQRGGNQMLVVR